MKVISILLVILTFILISLGAILIMRIIDPSAVATPILVVGLIVAAFGLSAALLSGLHDGSEFFEGLLSSLGFLADGKYKKKYLEYMFFRHRNFDVKGLTTQGVYTLELSRIFVELSVAPRNSQDMSNNPLKAPEKAPKGNYSIWHFLENSGKDAPNFAVIGVPGSGKTTMLKHMTLALIGRAQGQKYEIPSKLPILLFLRDHIQHISEDKDDLYSLEDAIQKDLARWDKTAPKGWFTNELNKGNCIVMLDGLDEVADLNIRFKVVEWADRQLVAYPKNSFIITSRPHGYRHNPLRDVTILEVKPFTSKQQIRFVENWYLANEIQSQQKDDEGVRIDAKVGSDDLLKRLYHTPKLAELAVNPLLLTMIATVHRYRSSLPGRRVELYAEICEVFLGKRQESKGLDLDLTPEQRKRVLQPLAWYMMQSKTRDLSKHEAEQIVGPTLKSVQYFTDPEIFLKNIENDSGLLIERESARYSFAHLTFQEFLSAEHVRDQPDLLSTLLTHVKESWWHEVLLLYAARADATPIIEACLSVKGEDDITALLLAVDCLEEAREVSPETQSRLDRVLEESLDGQDRQRVGILAKLLLQQRVRNFIRVDDGKAVDVSLLTNAEYQLFVDDVARYKKPPVPAHWQDDHYPFGQGSLPVLGVTIDAVLTFCNWLTKTLEDSYQYSIPLKIETKHIPMKASSEIACAGYWVKSGNKSSVEMFSGNYPMISLALLNRYRERALGTAVRMDNTQGVARRNNFNLDLNLHRYFKAARAFNLENARSNAIHLGYPGHRYIDQARELNRKANKRDLNPDLDICEALVRDLASESKNDFQRDSAFLLMIAGVLSSRLAIEEEELGWTIKNKQDYKDWVDLATRLMASYQRAFVNLCVLEERKKGELIAFEGIRLVRIREDG